MKKIIFYFLACILLLDCSHSSTNNKELVDQNIYDVVIQHGRVINPATQTDAHLNIAIQGDTIAAISAKNYKANKLLMRLI